ncbi:MAG: hypothetical protein IAE78_04410 [Myxococcus sp.]|nr:hypothetical protein [Myxococcus sp.]
MLTIFTAAALTALPALKPLQPPLAVFTVEVLKGDGPAEGGDRLITYAGPECSTRSVSSLRAMGAALTMLERVQQWLEQNPGAEAKLFKKGTLAAAMKHASQGAFTGLAPCRAPSLVDGWKWPATDLGKLCPAKQPGPSSQVWLAVKSQPSSALSVTAASTPCQPRLSIALFDPKGRARAVLHADFGGVMSAVLLGDRCQVEFTYDPDVEAFQAQWKSCKG